MSVPRLCPYLGLSRYNTVRRCNPKCHPAPPQGIMGGVWKIFLYNVLVYLQDRAVSVGGSSGRKTLNNSSFYVPHLTPQDQADVI